MIRHSILLLIALKAKISGSLMCQHSCVANSQFVILASFYTQLYLLAILRLKCDVIGMTMMVAVLVMMYVCFPSHIHDDGGYSQYRGILVLDKLSDIFCNDIEKEKKPKYNEYLHVQISCEA